MLTKQQKAEQIKEARQSIKESKLLLFTDFTGTSVEEIKSLRRSLRELEAKYKVVKKRLLRVALTESGVDFNPEQFDSQIGTIFASRDISEIASPVYKFAKGVEAKGFKILGAYDLENKAFIEGAMVKMIGQLPPREILLAQFVGMLAMPIKMFMYVLEQKSKKS